jgi:histidinol-phosphate aminotransferase
VSPNNPTGFIYTEEQIGRICKKCSAGVVIIDEAYGEFAGKTASSLVAKFDNLIVLKTLSKAFSLAGVRIGYIISNKEIMKDLSILYNPKSVNIFAHICSIAALEDIEYMERYVNEVDSSKVYLKKKLEKKGYAVFLTPGNFILIKVDNPAEFIEKLRRNGVYVRDRSYLPNMSGFIRVTVGTMKHAKILVERLGSL